MTATMCRHCGTSLHHTFCDLGESPLSNGYLKKEDLSRSEPVFPLHVYVCDVCFLVQLPEFQSPEKIFSDYAYFSSYSESWLDHARRYVDAMIGRFDLNEKNQVVEIASNDGYLLQYFQKKGVPVLGIEPAENVAKLAIAAGIPTLVKFFGTKTARALAAEGKWADLLLGNNVLAHVPDLNDFVAGLKILLKENGVITMEFPHLLCLIEQNQFDTIYHEHFSYFSLMTVQTVFQKQGLTLFDVEELPTHGGSLRIYACHAENKNRTTTSAVSALLQKEIQFGLNKLESYLSFTKRPMKVKQALQKFLVEAKQAGKTVAGYGAPAKGNTLLNYCGIKSDLLAYTVDRNPMKQGRFLPGTHISIHRPEHIEETKPDYLLILPWNLKEEIMKQMSHIRNWGGQFLVPIPGLEILP